MIRLIVIVLLLAGLYYGYRRILALPPAQRSKLWWKLGLGALVLLSLMAVVSGRMHWLGGLLAIVLAVAKFGAHTLFRLWPLLRASGKDAVFRTEHLEVRFLIKTSQLQGVVIQGPHQGAPLHDMAMAQLQELAEYYRDRDHKSFYLVQAFMQRASAAQPENEQAQPAFSGNPSRDEALLILGLSGNPSADDIVAAHRRLIQKLHPDRGGNDYLAARINQAKDVLLK